MKQLLLSLLALQFITLLFTHLTAQVAISTTSAVPDGSAMLDISSANKGLLVPRLNTMQRVSIPSPAKGLLVFDINSNTFWYHNGTNWQEITIASNAWSLTGNALTNPGVNFIGTTSNQNLRFKRNNIYAGDIDTLNTTFGLGAGNIPASSGRFNSVFGVKALSSNTTGNNNTATGNNTLFSNTSGYSNTGHGVNSLFNNTSGYYNTATGDSSLYSNTIGSINTAYGALALFSNTTASNNTAMGFYSMAANTTGDFNTATGSKALSSNTTGSSNTATGILALNLNTTGSFNTATGNKSLINNSTGGGNTAFGANSLISNTTGDNNTATGTNALFNNSTGFWNEANGESALYANTTGVRNSANGESSLSTNTTGNDNTAVGMQSLHFNSTGNSNVGVGTQALFWNTTGSENVAIGNGAGVAVDKNNLTNATAIGANSRVDCSNCMVLGSVDVQNQPNINVGIGTTNPSFLLDVAGRMRIRSGTGINTAGTWFNNTANTDVAAFTGMYSDSYVGLYGTGSGWGFLMNTQDGRVSIGSATPANGYKLSVYGKAICEEMVVQLKSAWPDYVFEKNYQLRPLQEVEKYIAGHKHLPDIPAASEIQQNGLAVGEVQARMLQKIEELTLYVVQLQKEIEQLKTASNESK